MSKELTGYRFLDKDPSIDLYREALRKSGVSEEQIHDMGGPTAHTLRMWDKGKTRKPQALGMAYAMAACGYFQQWTNPSTGDVLRPRFKDFHTPRAKVIPIGEGKKKTA